jgi:AraC-like DNA-binding protein
MNADLSPFCPRPGREGVVVALSDKRWYLRQWHAHDTLEINLVLRGSGHILLDKRRYPLLPGHLVWLWPGQWHVPSAWSADMLLWIVEWQPACLARLKKARRGDIPAPAEPAHPFCRRLAAPALQRLDGLLSALAATARADAFNRGLDFALFALWDEFLAAEPAPDCAAFHPQLETAIALLADPHGNLSQVELARRVKLSPFYLSDLFRKQTGLTIPAYRNRLRLQEFFRRYHAHPEIRLLQHALDSGFGSYAQFFRVFSDAMGAPPRAGLQPVAPAPARRPPPGNAKSRPAPRTGTERLDNSGPRIVYLT